MSSAEEINRLTLRAMTEADRDEVSEIYRQLGCREKIGKMQGKWRDTILFERRGEKF